MPLELPRLPYDRTALQPHLSAETLDLHHGRHHRGYVEAVNARIDGTELAELPLEDIVRQSQGSLFDAAAQAWNHAFYFQCLHPRGGGDPKDRLAELVTRHFGDIRRLREEFDRAALGLFGSGWVWLVQHPTGALAIQATRNAGTPLTGQSRPLLACDVWEHAYYTDYQNERARYLEAFWKLVNWDFVAAQLRD
ncbi:superoxide dismutase [Stenotrophomonas rhizophila]|jgi:Fe-Mn family superoxide dismutase|uniref:Superoxide dismutase n=1 Tax=Stenotrophomonas nematodicola TaxID=2656746 RepID=A0ABW7D2H6_9GAMM|nr:Fe-Mn family superoxide dismutase [Stenotrophomonas sp. BIGb0135]MCS4234216.1 Fe-Mn family superoxide dismutase [Stenotrophomonas sp. BIGb0135]